MSYCNKVYGAMLGVALGDGMGAPVEGLPPEKIADMFPMHDFTTFLPATHGGSPKLGKGDGRITDDTLMTEALIDAYTASGEHLDAYGFERWMLPEICDTVRYIPERGKTLLLYERLVLPERYPFFRMRIAHAEPRMAGVGNCVNCGVAMYMMPVGAVNAGAPYSAYQEAAALASAHNESYGVEGAAVMAAAYARAFAKQATIEDVFEVAVYFAKDGTRRALERCLAAIDPGLPVQAQTQRLRLAVAPFDPRPNHVEDDALTSAKDVNDMGRPSRALAAEEVPVAIALLAYGQGSFCRTVEACVRYGRDCDSIASMACGLLGALYGADAFPQELVQASQCENQRNFQRMAEKLVFSSRQIFQKDCQRQQEHRLAMA